MQWGKPKPGKTKGYNLKRKEKKKRGILSSIHYTSMFSFLLLILVEMEHKQITFSLT